MSPLHTRLALIGFLAAGAALATNMLYFQDPSVTSKSSRTKTERAKARAEVDRNRRLALDEAETKVVAAALKPAEIPQVQAAATGAAPPRPVAPATTRLGRFSPTSEALDRASPIPADAEMRMPDVVKGLQSQLTRRGYEPGTADGVIGITTRAAIMAYEHDQGLPLTAEPSESLLQHMQGVTIARLAGPRPSRAGRTPNVEHLIRTVQQSLAQLGYFSGRIDGLAGEDTTRAIREYEMDVGLVPSGRVSAPLVVRLARSSASAGRAAR